jgi:nucleotidyltransferase substrate binding protein (TIGR01987 family)
MSKADWDLTAVQNFRKALAVLEEAVAAPVVEPRDRAGIIKNFEIVYELSWNCLKKFLEKEGHEVKSARETFAKAYQLNYLHDEQRWLAILKDRNLTVHIYDETFAKEMCARITTEYVGAFRELATVLGAAT